MNSRTTVTALSLAAIVAFGATSIFAAPLPNAVTIRDGADISQPVFNRDLVRDEFLSRRYDRRAVTTKGDPKEKSTSSSTSGSSNATAGRGNKAATGPALAPSGGKASPPAKGGAGAGGKIPGAATLSSEPVEIGFKSPPDVKGASIPPTSDPSDLDLSRIPVIEPGAFPSLGILPVLTDSLDDTEPTAEELENSPSPASQTGAAGPKSPPSGLPSGRSGRPTVPDIAEPSVSGTGTHNTEKTTDPGAGTKKTAKVTQTEPNSGSQPKPPAIRPRGLDGAILHEREFVDRAYEYERGFGYLD